MAYYRKKPVIIEAFRFGFDDAPDRWLQARQGDDVYIVTPEGDMLEGDMLVGLGDFEGVIKATGPRARTKYS